MNPPSRTALRQKAYKFLRWRKAHGGAVGDLRAEGRSQFKTNYAASLSHRIAPVDVAFVAHERLGVMDLGGDL